MLAASEVGSGRWGGLAARDEAEAKGLVFADEELGLAKGLEEDGEEELGLAPKIDDPRFCFGFSCSCAACDGGLGAVCCEESLLARVALKPLTLPSFRLQALRRHPRRYNRLSCPAKRSGKSPFSSSKRLRSSLQTLHLARSPDGAVLPSSHTCKSMRTKLGLYGKSRADLQDALQDG